MASRRASRTRSIWWSISLFDGNFFRSLISSNSCIYFLTLTHFPSYIFNVESLVSSPFPILFFSCAVDNVFWPPPFEHLTNRYNTLTLCIKYTNTIHEKKYHDINKVHPAGKEVVIIERNYLNLLFATPLSHHNAHFMYDATCRHLPFWDTHFYPEWILIVSTNSTSVNMRTFIFFFVL